MALLLFVSRSTAVEPGDVAPACRLPTLDRSDQPIDTASPGQIVYVDFWASWCRPCRDALPFVDGLARDYRDHGLRVIGVNVDENAADALAFRQRIPMTFASGGDPAGACARSFGLKGMPTSYLIDRNGAVRYVHPGFRPGQAAAIRARIEALLAEPSNHRHPSAPAGDAKR